jgi:hypothetical protein
LPATAVGIAELWEHGFTTVEWRRGRERQRNTAKYLSKEFALRPASGDHRYSLARGFTPESTRIVENTEAGLWEAVRTGMGREPDRIGNLDDSSAKRLPRVRQLWWD